MENQPIKIIYDSQWNMQDSVINIQQNKENKKDKCESRIIV